MSAPAGCLARTPYPGAPVEWLVLGTRFWVRPCWEWRPEPAGFGVDPHRPPTSLFLRPGRRWRIDGAGILRDVGDDLAGDWATPAGGFRTRAEAIEHARTLTPRL